VNAEAPGPRRDPSCLFCKIVAGEIPSTKVAEDDIDIKREEAHTVVDASYVRPVSFVPGYTYKLPFKLHVDTFSVDTPVQGGSTPK